MNLMMIDLMEKAIANDTQEDLRVLMKEGIITDGGTADLVAVNLLVGERSAEIVDIMVENDVDIVELLEGMKRLMCAGEVMGAYFFLFYLFATMEIPVPRLFMQLPAHRMALECYIKETIADIEDCMCN